MKVEPVNAEMKASRRDGGFDVEMAGSIGHHVVVGMSKIHTRESSSQVPPHMISLSLPDDPP
eukprot:CAMPEP_0184325006 /NCGR_PEP_ID=MMETSP1049-20130417/138052_1 /TAXON_ID=77928 /ORGANISM="Proteomonas sulcata, Strain CCMP704" /LENGTH=61 /DNA_ID=CAMNT_0026646929 /DNA_START=298 /DNA_END=483 /DNA_ORIENTATION=-